MNAASWFAGRSFNGRLDVADENQPHKIMHTGTGCLVATFNNRGEAEKWLAQYGVSQEYKDSYYRIEAA